MKVCFFGAPTVMRAQPVEKPPDRAHTVARFRTIEKVMDPTLSSSIDLRTLGVFETVARCGSFAQAGRQLQTPRGVVSRLIAGLEAALGVRLFDRTTRKVMLTPQGQALLAQIAPHLDGLSSAISSVQWQARRAEGPVRLSVSHAFGRAVLLPLLGAFRERHPGIHVEVSLADGIADLMDEQIDVAVRMGELPASALVARSLGRLPVSLVGARSLLSRIQGPTEIEQLAQMPTIAFRIPGSGALYRWRFRRSEHAVVWQPAAPVLTLNSIEAVVDAVRAGLGVAPVPTYLVQDDLQRRRLRRLLPHFELPSIPVHVCFLQRRLLPARTRQLIDFLTEEIRL